MPTDIIHGLSLDGLLDACYPDSKARSPCMSDIVLLDDGVLVGEEAELSRHASGMPWPPQARVRVSNHIMPPRLPVPWAWRLLIDAGSQHVYWNGTSGKKFRIDEALAEHVSGFVEGNSIDKFILAIPNDLNEYGQEWIRRAIQRRLVKHSPDSVKFLWRPVAAALSLIEGENFEPPNSSEKGYVLVVHFGPDAFEVTSFSLCHEKDESGSYLVPVRDRGRSNLRLCGCDLADNWITNELLDRKQDFSAWWQAFTGFVETWQGLCEIQIPERQDCVPWWSETKGWQAWEVNQAAFADTLSLNAHRKDNLASLKGSEESQGVTWREYIIKCICEALSVRGLEETLVGVAVSGELLPQAVSELTISTIKAIFKGKVHPEALNGDNFLRCSNSNNLVARGASLYAERVRRDRIGYWDIVEQLYVWAKGDDGMGWFGLLNNLKVSGEERLPNFSSATFRLKSGTKDLELFIKKGENNSGIKRAITKFPYVPQADVILRVKTIISTASGFIEIEFIPENPEYLGGHRVFFNFETMVEASAEELSKDQKGYQDELLSIQSGNNDELLERYGYSIEKWVKTSTKNASFHNLSLHVRKVVRGIPHSRSFNKDGVAWSENVEPIFETIRKKLGDDFKDVVNDLELRKVKNAILTTSKWYYTSLPSTILTYLLSNLRQGTLSANEIRILGTCITDKEDILCLFDKAESSLRNGNYEDAWIFTLYHILNLRATAATLMSKQQAECFVRTAFWHLKDLVANRKINKKFLTVLGFLQGVLRYRAIDAEYPGNKLIEQLIDVLDRSGEVLLDFPPKIIKVRESLESVIPEVRNYLLCKGSANVLEHIQKAVESDEDGEEEDG